MRRAVPRFVTWSAATASTDSCNPATCNGRPSRFEGRAGQAEERAAGCSQAHCNPQPTGASPRCNDPRQLHSTAAGHGSVILIMGYGQDCELGDLAADKLELCERDLVGAGAVQGCGCRRLHCGTRLERSTALRSPTACLHQQVAGGAPSSARGRWWCTVVGSQSLSSSSLVSGALLRGSTSGAGLTPRPPPAPPMEPRGHGAGGQAAVVAKFPEIWTGRRLSMRCLPSPVSLDVARRIRRRLSCSYGRSPPRHTERLAVSSEDEASPGCFSR